MKGHMVTGTRGGHQITQHASFFKKFGGKVDKKPSEDDVSEDQDEEANTVMHQKKRNHLKGDI